MDVGKVALFEACIAKSCTVMPPSGGRKVISVDLSDWLGICSNISLEQITQRYDCVYLTLRCVPNLTSRACSQLADAIGHKLIGLCIDSCQDVTWSGEVVRLLANTKALESLTLKTSKWVDDFVIEQLSVRFKRSLTSVTLENVAVSNNALFQIGRRCTALRTLNLICCPHVSDVGLLEMAKTVHISELNLSHNMKVTDKGVEAIVFCAKQMTSVVFLNCPKLTNQTVGSLYEAVASWGRKRNTESEPITYLELRDNANVDAELLLWVSACLPNLTHLDLRDCVSVHPVKAMNEMISALKIRTLKLGPSKYKVDSAKFLQCMVYQAPQLIVLHLSGIRGFSDDHIGELIEQALSLEELLLCDLDFGTSTIESICSNIPNISRLSLIGSAVLADIDMRCLCTICRNLVELTVRRCPRLTDSAFTRCVSLKMLRLLDLADLSLPAADACSSSANARPSTAPDKGGGAGRSACTGGILQFFTLSPLRTLVLDGLLMSAPQAYFASLTKSTITELTTLSLKHCPLLTLSSLHYLLAQYPACRELDCTGCPDLPPAHSAASPLHSLQHTAPFLRFVSTTEFCGFRLQPTDRVRYMQFFAHQEQLRRHYGAKLMQRLRRRYLKRLLELKQMRRERWTDFKLMQVIRIQAAVRGFQVRRRVAVVKAQGSAIVKAARDVIVYRNYLIAKKMRKYYRTQLKSRVFNGMYRHAQMSMQQLDRISEQVRALQRRRCLKSVYRTFREQLLELRERKFEDCAGAFAEVKFLQKILRHWRTVVFETSTKNQRLVRKFMAVANLRTYNSFRQLGGRHAAESFCNRRLMMAAWLCLARDYLVVKRINSLEPMALDHAARTFFTRVVGATFKSMQIHRENRLIKRAAKIRGQRHYALYKLLKACQQVCKRMDYCLAAKASFKTSEHQRRSYLTRLAFQARFPTITRQTIYYKERVKMIKQYIRDRSTVVGFVRFKLQVIAMKQWRILRSKAEIMRHRNYYKHMFAAWHLFKVNSKNLGALYYKRYMDRVCKRILFSLRMNVAMQKEYVRTMQLEVEKRAKDAQAFNRFVARITKLQAKVRAVRQRMRFAEEKVQKLYSIQVLQNFFRTCLARKEYASRLRKREIAERVREDTELDLMREAEAECRYYEYRLKAIINFQRIFRGWKGRKIAAEAAVLFYRDESRDYYSKNQHMRLRHEAFKRAAIARENLRHKAAAQIQKRVRGMQARARFVGIKHQAKIARYAVYVQREYRRRLAMLKLQAMKRDKKSEIRFKAARRQRGLVLRLLGFKNRKQQSQFGKVLDEMGMDPLSFNYRLGELVAETIADFHNLVSIFKRERALVEEHGLNRLAVSMGRRKVLVTQGWKLKVQDAVRIVERGHKYEGYTGVICRIDETLLGLPLYEVKLDRFNRQTFARMTTDAFSTYAYPQPLSKIQVKPKLVEFEQAPVIFGIDNSDPFYSKKNVSAAWTLQRAFRVFRAKKIASRKRYELWLRSAARQWSLMNHLAETNTLNMQAHNVAGLLGVRPVKPVFFDEIRHPFLPARLTSTVAKEAEAVAIKREFDYKMRDRIAYLQKCAIMQGREYFAVGYEKLTYNRKLSLFSSMAYGLMFKKKAPQIRDVQGARGVQVLAKQQALVTGMDKYRFEQFVGSPHVRYYKMSLYQGEWSGIPLFTPLKPHGSGVVVFLDGWGYAREDKVLYLTIIRCRYLNAMDISSSDPYCEINCNGLSLQSSVKWANLNPEYHESFEIDVTNPSAILNIVVKDRDYFGSDDFMGQVNIELSEFADGKEVEKVYQLLGEDVKELDDADRGEIHVRLRWAERKFEDDQALDKLKLTKLIKLQAWARRISGLMVLKKLRKEREALMAMVRVKAVKITNTCRIRLARKEYKRRSRFVKSAIKIQKRVRIWIAKRVFKRKKLRHLKAIIIQSRMRVCLAKARVLRIKAKMNADLHATVAVIQKNVRRMIVRIADARRKAEELRKAKEQAEEDGVPYEPPERPPVTSWISTYGVDPEYRLKRNRRITERLFQRMLKMKYVRFLSRFGVVYLESYPPKTVGEEALEMAQQLQLEQAGGTADGAVAAAVVAQQQESNALTVKKDFVSVYLPPFEPTKVHRRAAIERCNKITHLAILHLPTAVQMRGSVDYNVSTIQCLQRQRLARREREKLIRVHKSIALFQRIFRRRYEVFFKASVKISTLFRMNRAKKRTAILRKEYNAALTLQCAYRCYVARSKHFDRRCVAELAVLKSSPEAVPLHGPEKALEHREDTFWIAESNERAEIRVEFAKVETITEIWIMTSTYSTSPNFVSISAVIGKDKSYTELVERTELPLLKQYRWHKFALSFTVSKYYKLVFFENYGDEHHIAVRQIRFLRSIEKSATIVKQPSQFIMEAGPTVGETAQLTLRCVAEGWPTPTFQWYKGNTPIPGATKSELKLTLSCPTYGNRSYRCIRCKMVSRKVPENAFHIKCGNCSTLFAYKDVEEYDKRIAAVKEEEAGLHKDKTALLASRLQMESFQNEKYAPVIADLNERIAKVEDKLQALRERRIEIKRTAPACNHFSDEGVYFCYVQNYRGGSMRMRRKSVGAVVVVEHSVPYLVPVSPVYTPREQKIRKKWNVYASLQGTFKRGRVEGIVVIRYQDGSFYEGPYISEDAIDLMGRTLPAARPRNHYGVYKLPDGRVFEGTNVDNHFDPHNLNSYYRMSLPNKKGVYEGHFCDETFHGTGMFTYEDGSVYEGTWFRGSRFGHGHYRSAQGWTYEGFYDTSRRHRNGVINWPDGSCYLGEWYYDEIRGKGIYITALRDVYRGELMNGLFHGQGEMIYADGSRYLGEFKEGKRNGRGIFTEREGNEYYGQFVDDLREGEHVCKLIIAIEVAGQDNHEIKIGVFSKGVLVKWKSKFSNPIATKQFIALFKKNREMFDSVFSMILAKNLPALPEGIDANNEQVKQIVFKIRNEAGMLVGEHALNMAQAQLKALLQPIKEKADQIEQLKKDIEDMSVAKIALEKDAAFYFHRYNDLMTKYEKDTQKIEQYWFDEPTEVRAVFQLACKALDTLSVDEYFSFRNHRTVPTFVKKIFDAISCLLDLSFDWAEQQYIIADAIANARNGDDEALRHNYKCKLSFLMKNYRVYDHVMFKEQDRLAVILADSRFHRDSYYIQSTGPPGPILVDWIKTNFAYVKAARALYETLHEAEQLKVKAFRFKATQAKKREETEELGRKIEATHVALRKALDEQEELQHLLLKANDLLEFITGRYNFGQTEAKQDYYKLMEQRLEAQRDRFTIEVCLQGIINAVEERADKEKQARIREVLAAGLRWEEPVLQRPQIMDWITDEVRSQQTAILQSGNTLGYGFEPVITDVSKEYTGQLISLIIDIVTGKLNDIYNDLAVAKSWLSMKGKTISSRFLYVLTWKVWEEQAVSMRDAQAVEAWESIFGTPEACARMAIEARISVRMSAVAREQAKVWAKGHPEEIRQAEEALSWEFQQEYGGATEDGSPPSAEMIQEVARQALALMADESGTVPPSAKAACASWIRLHPEEMNAARDEQNAHQARLFEEQFPTGTAEVCFKVLNGWGNSEEMQWVAYADHWRAFNTEKYDLAADALLKEMSGDFADAYPVNTYMEAARVLESDAVYHYITDPEVRAEYEINPKELLNAQCWATLNQGMVRKGRTTLAAQSQSNVTKQWAELTLLTENFQKGSVLFSHSQPVTYDEQGNPVDRFLGFRNRLSNKFAWMYGYLCLQQVTLGKEIADLALVDPIEKVLHRVRPSQLEQVKRAREDEYQAQRRKLDAQLEAVVSKLVTWNTYFGLTQGVDGEAAWGEWDAPALENGEGQDPQLLLGDPPTSA